MTVSPDVLATCLESIRSGRLTVDECVAANPTIDAELRAILEVATSIVPPLGQMDPVARARGRAALIVTMAHEKPVVTNSLGPRYLQSMLAALTRPQNIIVRIERRPALLIALVIVLTTALGSGAVAASGEALPGDVLYPVKLTIGNVQIATTNTEAAKAQLSLRQASSRVAEIDRAYQTGRTDAIGPAAANYIQNVADANQHVANAAASGQNVDDLANGLNGELAGQHEALKSDEARAPADSRSALNAAARVARSGITVRNGPGGIGLSESHGTIPDTATPTNVSDGTVPESPTETATVGGTVPFAAPTETVEPSETPGASAAPTRTREVEPTDVPEPTESEDTPTAGPSATPHPHGEPSETAEATKTPGDGNHGGDGNGGGDDRTPTSIASTPVLPSATAKPTHEPEPTEVHGPTNTPQPTATPQPTHVGEPTEGPRVTNTPGSGGGNGSPTPKPTEVEHQPTQTPVPPATSRPTQAPTPRPTEKSGGGGADGGSGSDH